MIGHDLPVIQAMGQSPQVLARLTEEEQAERQKDHRWSPNQLRHAAATEIRQRFGLEAAQVVLGHSRADVTQVYAERDNGLAAKIMSEVG
jgi:site-specific recombinase XerC